MPVADPLDALFTDPKRLPAEAALRAAAAERILIIDGAMGTEIQGLKLKEADFRGEKFRDCACALGSNYDILAMTQPAAIEAIHYAYAKAGADILETNTFSATSIGQAEFGLEAQVYDLNRDAVRLARRAALRAEREDGKRRFVAGDFGQMLAHLVGAERAIEADRERLGVAHRMPKGGRRLAGQRAPGRVRDRAGDHDRPR